MTACRWFPRHVLASPGGAAGLLLAASVARAQFFTDTGSPVNPDWSAILPTLNNDAADPGPVYGSVIQVSNTAVETGLYGNRPIAVGTQKIHVCCNTSVSADHFPDFTRWYQTDGQTEVFRLFVNDENTATTRVGAARCEAFNLEKWSQADGRTYEWTGRFTVAKRQQSYSIFQVMNEDNEWAVHLDLTSAGTLVVNNRRNEVDVTVTDPDGSPKLVDGVGFDVRILDDGDRYKVWIDGVLWADNVYARPTGLTNFRWGMYMGDATLVAPSDSTVLLVSGARVMSWSGDLGAATTEVVKANNAQNLENAASWTGGAVPGLHNLAVWNSTVTAANATQITEDQTWAGIRIVNPGGLVTIGGTATLGLDTSGLDMSAATRSLVVNCPVELRDEAVWNIAAAPTATFNGVLSGYAGITLGGGGTAILNAPNTYTGPTTIQAGTLQLGNGGSTGALSTVSAIRVDAGATFAVNQSDTVTQGSHFSGSPITGAGGVLKAGTGTLALVGTNAYSGPTTISAGTLQLGTGGTTASLNTNSVISVATGATFAVNRSNTIVQGSGFSAAPITGGGGLAKIGTGTLVLTAANAFTGPTTISAGTLQLGNGGTTGTLNTSSAISVATGATLAMNRSNSIVQGSGFSAAPITGGGGLAKAGTGTLVLTAANAFTGPTTISAGTLQLGNGGTTGTLNTNSVISVATGATLAMNRSNSIVQGTGFSAAPISGGGGLAKAGTGALVLTAANAFTGPTTISAGTVQLGNGGNTGTLNTNSVISVATGTTFAVNRSNAVSQGVDFSGIPLQGDGGLAKVGTGLLTLTANNAHGGPTTVLAGTLAFRASAPFDRTSVIALSPGTLLRPLADGAVIRAPITTAAAGGGVSISAPTDLPGAGVVSVLTLDDAVSGAGGVTFTSSAAQNALSTVRLNAACTYAGSTRLDTAGTAATQIILKLGTHNALPVTTVLTIDGQDGQGTGRFAELNLNGFDQQLAGLTNVSRTLRVQRVVNSSAAAAATLTLHNAGDHVFSGALGGSANGSVSASSTPGSLHGNHFALVKDGAGTFSLVGALSYTGDTTVRQGTLVLGTANANNQTSTLTVAAAGAAVQLAFTGADTVDRLIIGTTAMPAGVYAAVGNPAGGIPLRQLGGTGTLTVTSGPPAGYAAWQVINGTDQPIGGDHDGDGVTNGIECFVAGPLANSTGATLPAGFSATTGLLRATWPKAATYTGVYGTDYVVESAPAPSGPWTVETLGNAVLVSANQVVYTFPSGPARHYARLRVSGP